MRSTSTCHPLRAALAFPSRKYSAGFSAFAHALVVGSTVAASRLEDRFVFFELYTCFPLYFSNSAVVTMLLVCPAIRVQVAKAATLRIHVQYKPYCEINSMCALLLYKPLLQRIRDEILYPSKIQQSPHSIQLPNLRNQLPRIPTLKQHPPSLRNLLKRSPHQRLLVLDHQLSLLHGSGEGSHAFGESGHVVEDDEALEVETAGDDLGIVREAGFVKIVVRWGRGQTEEEA